MSPERGIELVNRALASFKKIHSPRVCRNHYDLSINILKSILNYQYMRQLYVDDKERKSLEAKMRNEQIHRLKLEDEKSKEYFRVLHKIGLYDNAMNEMVNLRLITKEQKEKCGKLGVKSKQ